MGLDTDLTLRSSVPSSRAQLLPSRVDALGLLDSDFPAVNNGLKFLCERDARNGQVRPHGQYDWRLPVLPRTRHELRGQNLEYAELRHQWVEVGIRRRVLQPARIGDMLLGEGRV